MGNEERIDFRLYLITDRHALPPGGDLLSAVEAALAGGVGAVQLREKDLPTRELFELALALLPVTRRHGARLFINDRIDLVQAVGADGVHLGGHSLPTTVARRLLGPDKLVGVSTHTPKEGVAAWRDGADFITFGPVYFTPSKAPYGPPAGLEALKEACARTPLPVFALGGITPDRVPEILDAGASGAAAISALLAGPDPEGAARAMVRGIRSFRK